MLHIYKFLLLLPFPLGDQRLDGAEGHGLPALAEDLQGLTDIRPGAPGLPDDVAQCDPAVEPDGPADQVEGTCEGLGRAPAGIGRLPELLRPAYGAVCEAEPAEGPEGRARLTAPETEVPRDGRGADLASVRYCREVG